MPSETRTHTPGPWEIWEGPAYVGGGEDLCIGAGETWLLNMDHRHNPAMKGVPWEDLCGGLCEKDACDICSIGDEITAEQRANARLIASAPALLEALEGLLTCHEDALRDADLDPSICPEAEAARAALRSARGEGVADD